MWTRESCLELIKTYASYQMLWDPRHKEFYNKHKREDIWEDIAEKWGKPKTDLLAKMKSLSGSYRRERNRERRSQGFARQYQSQWFAYEAFSFLRDKDLVAEDSPDNHLIEVPSVEDNEEPDDVTYENEEESEASQTEQPPLTTQAVPAPPHNLLKRKYCTIDDGRPGSSKISQSSHIPQQIEQSHDPYVSFGLHIASELRKYDALTLAHVKHAINNIIFQADSKFLQVNKEIRFENTSLENVQLIQNIKMDNDGEDYTCEISDCL
ncbi:uncharacterized protein LOC135072230 [Ostrinia nubilalis]|uniref:uncharacterized protein LOC135072230 n=1 Tax=Ostrinia nubilalis TaxID=29057 RepID=UPI00308223A5